MVVRYRADKGNAKQCDIGAYVLYRDYAVLEFRTASLQAERDRLKAENERLIYAVKYCLSSCLCDLEGADKLRSALRMKEVDGGKV